jgi:hypothetical protein
MLVASKVDNKVFIGWSLCHTPLDTFCSERAKQIALGRIVAGHAPKVPASILPQVRTFHARCRKYYKQTPVELIQPKSEKEVKTA